MTWMLTEAKLRWNTAGPNIFTIVCFHGNRESESILKSNLFILKKPWRDFPLCLHKLKRFVCYLPEADSLLTSANLINALIQEPVCYFNIRLLLCVAVQQPCTKQTNEVRLLQVNCLKQKGWGVPCRTECSNGKWWGYRGKNSLQMELRLYSLYSTSCL